MSKQDLSNVIKGANVIKSEATDHEMELINKLTLTPLNTEDVFTFKLVMMDNDIDRHFERFSDSSIDKFAELFVGKPVIKDHTRKADNQIGRIYAAEVVVKDGETTQVGTTYRQLVAHCYVLNTDTNKDLIADIKGGIKKEVSVGVRVGKAVCSICGVDNTKTYCEHYWGKEYDGDICHFTLDEATDAFEVSFVAVPAQPKAGTTKSKSEKEKDKQETVSETDDALHLRLKALDAFIFIQKENMKEEE